MPKPPRPPRQIKRAAEPTDDLVRSRSLVDPADPDQPGLWDPPAVGPLLLKNYPHSKVRLTCLKCSRGARFDKAALIARAGPEIAMLDLRLVVGEAWGCELAAARRADRAGAAEDCGLIYPDLITFQ